MKKLALGICIILWGIMNSFAQKREVCIPWNKTMVPIYANQLADSIVFTVYQDFDAEDHIYEVFVVEKSPLRFKIEFRDLYDNTNTVKTGWIDKKYSGVFGRWYYDDQNRPYIKLYTRPNTDSEFINIYQIPEQALTVVDYENDFIEVMFQAEGSIYTGWVDRYCCNIFNNCS